jgi:hypothetical protein
LSHDTITASRRLSEQDELTCAIHKVAVETIQMAGDVPMGAFVVAFTDEYPTLWDD